MKTGLQTISKNTVLFLHRSYSCKTEELVTSGRGRPHGVNCQTIDSSRVFVSPISEMTWQFKEEVTQMHFLCCSCRYQETLLLKKKR